MQCCMVSIKYKFVLLFSLRRDILCWLNAYYLENFNAELTCVIKVTLQQGLELCSM
jgi:hypothetical protein